MHAKSKKLHRIGWTFAASYGQCSTHVIPKQVAVKNPHSERTLLGNVTQWLEHCSGHSRMLQFLTMELHVFCRAQVLTRTAHDFSYHGQLFFGEVKNSLGAHLGENIVFSLSNKVGTPPMRGRHFMFIVFRRHTQHNKCRFRGSTGTRSSRRSKTRSDSCSMSRH